MRRIAIALACLTALAIPKSATAVTLTFDTLHPDINCAAACPLFPYSEGGFTFTMLGGASPHYGDGAQVDQTLSWHEGGNNDPFGTVRLTASDSSLFDLVGFDIADLNLSGGSVLVVSDVGGGALSLTGTYVVNFNGASFVDFKFSLAGVDDLALDNVILNSTAAVPLPPAVALFATGVAGLSWFARRRRKRSASI
jgi:hypothetical protein